MSVELIFLLYLVYKVILLVIIAGAAAIVEQLGGLFQKGSKALGCWSCEPHTEKRRSRKKNTNWWFTSSLLEPSPCLFLITKTSHPFASRSVFLISHNSPKSHLLTHQSNSLSTSQGSLQFAYRVGIVDAIIHLLQQGHSHLDETGSTLRIVFFDFFRAFNKMQPMLCCKKLHKMQVDALKTTWVIDYLMELL